MHFGGPFSRQIAWWSEMMQITVKKSLFLPSYYPGKIPGSGASHHLRSRHGALPRLIVHQKVSDELFSPLH